MRDVRLLGDHFLRGVRKRGRLLPQVRAGGRGRRDRRPAGAGHLQDGRGDPQDRGSGAFDSQERGGHRIGVCRGRKRQERHEFRRFQVGAQQSLHRRQVRPFRAPAGSLLDRLGLDGKKPPHLASRLERQGQGAGRRTSAGQAGGAVGPGRGFRRAGSLRGLRGRQAAGHSGADQRDHRLQSRPAGDPCGREPGAGQTVRTGDFRGGHGGAQRHVRNGGRQVPGGQRRIQDHGPARRRHP